MKHKILIFFLLIILSVSITYIKFCERFNNNYYKSVTKILGNYEVYSSNDKYYPKKKINLKKRNNLIKLFKYGDEFFQKNNINYSIMYGSLLGYIRNKKIIPYDNDNDCIIGKESINKLIKLGNDKNVKNVIFNDEIQNYNVDFNSDNIYLILNKSILTNKGYGKRFNCNGIKIKRQKDACSFNGPYGRFILKKYYYDVFGYSHNLKNLIRKSINDIVFPKKLDDMCIIENKDIIRSKLENVNISVFTESKANNILKLRYGKNYMKPNK